MIAKNIETDTSVAVDIWMINACREVYLQRKYQCSVSRKKSDEEEGLQREGLWLLYLWWFEGVVCGKMNREEEHTTGIWTIALKTQSVYILLTNGKREKYRSHNRGLPVKL